MNRKAFTLLELMLVVAIMGFMGAMAVGGYRAMRRGMEERSVMQNANMFIRSAYQRAQIDRLPVAVYFWNETQRQASNSGVPLVVGKAVAVRRAGRLTKVPDASTLMDEFGDLRFNRLILDEDDDEEDTSTSSKGVGVFLYRMNGDEGSQMMRSTVKGTTVKKQENAYIRGRQISYDVYAYSVQDKNGVSWKAGDAYGFEFEDLTLPANYLFGSSWSQSVQSPVKGETVIRFLPKLGGASQSSGTGDTIQICSLRPGASGTLEAKRVGTTDSPTKQLEN